MKEFFFHNSYIMANQALVEFYVDDVMTAAVESLKDSLERACKDALKNSKSNTVQKATMNAFKAIKDTFVDAIMDRTETVIINGSHEQVTQDLKSAFCEILEYSLSAKYILDKATDLRINWTGTMFQ